MARFAQTTNLAHLFAMFVSLAANAADDPALVAHYTFDEGPSDTVKDASRYGNHGKNLGAKYVPGPPGTGHVLRFEDASAYVDCGNRPSLNLTGSMTIELWLYGENERQSGGEPGLGGKSIDSHLHSYSGHAWYYLGPDRARTDCSAPAPIKTWHHVVATFDERAARTYTDGELQNTVAAPSTEVAAGGHFFLRYPVIWGGKVIPPVTVMMDEVRVYNRCLSADEIRNHYLDEAQARGHDLEKVDTLKVAAHVIPATNAPVIEVDYGDLRPVPHKGELLRITVRDHGGDLVASHQLPVTHDRHVAAWTSSTSLAPGSYRYEVRMADTRPAAGPLTVKPLDAVASAPFGNATRLNNFVAELADVPDANGRVTFTNPRNGWVWVRRGAVESMRYLKRGNHTLAAHGRVVVRAIPELIYTELGYDPSPWVKSYGPYTWDYLETIKLLDNTNVVLIRDSNRIEPGHLSQWSNSGKRHLLYYNLHWLLQKDRPLTARGPFSAWSATLGTSDYGLLLDELAGHSYAQEFPFFTDAIRRIAADPALREKVFYPYCNDLYGSQPARDFCRALFDAGYRLVEEEYLLEQPTLAAARDYMTRKLKLSMLRYQDFFPRAATQTVIGLGYISLPHETQNIYPDVDYRVYLDMQMHLLANDPAFRGLYGLLWYHGSYADEEILRWSVALNRHYCIEGRRDRLTKDPYLLPHISNGDFHDRARGWTVQPAEQGGIFTASSPRFGWLQGRFQRDVWSAADATGGGLADGVGDQFVVMTSNGKRPNRLLQTVESLVPGRLYSVRMFTADYRELASGHSTARDHHMRFEIENADVQPELSFMEIVTNGGGHYNALFKGDNKFHFNWHRVVFRAKQTTSRLVITDRGAQAGQQTIINGVELAPYLEH